MPVVRQVQLLTCTVAYALTCAALFVMWGGASAVLDAPSSNMCVGRTDKENKRGLRALRPSPLLLVLWRVQLNGKVPFLVPLTDDRLVVRHAGREAASASASA